MLPNVTKDAGSILHFERQPRTLVNANRPSALIRLYFLKLSTGGKFVATQEIPEPTVNC